MANTENTLIQEASHDGIPSTQDFSKSTAGSTIAQIFGIPNMPEATQEPKEPKEVKKETSTEKETSIEEDLNTNKVTSDNSEQIESGENVTDDNDDFDNDKKRAAYWQSQHDKIMQDYQNAMATVNQLYQQTQGQQVKEDPKPEYQLPPKPEAPVLPTNYSLSDAYSNPDSASAKYHVEKEQYERKLNDWNEVRQEVSQKQLQEEIEAYKKQQQAAIEAEQRKTQMQQQYASTINLIKKDYSEKYKLSDDDITKIIQDMTDPKAYTPENVVKLWLINNKRLQSQYPAQIPPKVPPKSQTMEQTKKAQSVPPTMGVQTTVNEDRKKVDPGTAFMDMMIKNTKDTRITL